MDFTDLTRLWWLLALPVAIWLARPPRPRRREATAHLAQWRAAIAAVGRRPVRWRFVRLLLLLLAGTALVLAATGPRLAGHDGPRRLVVLLDRSASMGRGDAWAEALEELTRILEAVPNHVEVRVLDCADRPIPVIAASRGDLRAHLPSGPISGSGSVDLAALADAVATDDVAVHTITDARGGSVPRRGGLRRVGRQAPNVAITACRVVDAWPRPEFRLECSCERTEDAPPMAEIRVMLGGDELARHVLEFRSNVASYEATFERRGGGRLTIELLGADTGFPADDRVAFDVPPAARPNVAVLGLDDSAGTSVGVAARLLAEFGGGAVLDSGADRAGFVLASGGRLARLPPRAILFGTRVGPGTVAGRRERPTVVDWDRSDPLLAGIDLSELRVSHAVPAAALPDGTAIIDGSEGPLAVAVERESGGRSVCFAFRLEDSNLALLAAFPQILGRAYRAAWGAAAAPRPVAGNVLSRAESFGVAASVEDRALPDFGGEDRRLVVPLVLLAMFALALRILL